MTTEEGIVIGSAAGAYTVPLDSAVTKQGYLLKADRSGKFYRKRFFVLRHNALFYRHNLATPVRTNILSVEISVTIGIIIRT